MLIVHCYIYMLYLFISSTSAEQRRSWASSLRHWKQRNLCIWLLCAACPSSLVRELWLDWLGNSCLSFFKSENFNHLRHQTRLHSETVQGKLPGGSAALIFSHLMFSFICAVEGGLNTPHSSVVGSLLEIGVKAEGFIDSNNFVVKNLSRGFI